MGFSHARSFIILATAPRSRISTLAADVDLLSLNARTKGSRAYVFVIWQRRSVDTADQSHLGRALLNCLILLSAGAAAIHFAVIGDHFAEYWVYGMFFAVAAWLQILWAIALASKGSRRLLFSGVLGNTIIVAVWVISRTSGLPVGPQSGTRETVNFTDFLATSFEALIVVGSVVLLGGSAERPRVGARTVMVTTVATALIVVPLTTVAIASVSVPDKGSDVFHEPPQLQMPHR